MVAAESSSEADRPYVITDGGHGRPLIFIALLRDASRVLTRHPNLRASFPTREPERPVQAHPVPRCFGITRARPQ